MDALELAAVTRATAALTAITNSREGDQRAGAAAFRELAWTMLTTNRNSCGDVLRASRNPLVSKAAAHAIGDEVWSDSNAAQLANAYLASIAEMSIIDALKRYCTILPPRLSHVLVASGAVADVAGEGEPKAVRNLGLVADGLEPVKAAGIMVLSDELAKSAGVGALFERELMNTVVRASNLSALEQLRDSSTSYLGGTRSGDPLADLRLALSMVAPSYGYVVAMPSVDVAVLATTIEAGPGFTVRGGTFRPGIEIIAVDHDDDTTVIPASRVALTDYGLQVRSARHATVEMRDSEEDPSEFVSLWQKNCMGLLVERTWKLISADGVVAIQGGSSSA